ncbi:MAG: hypothetical protein ABI609_14290 [Acidobacteriota bacterium]
MAMLRSFVAVRRFAAALGLAALGSVAFGICLCDDDASPEANPGCHQSTPAKTPSNRAWTKTCCCADAATLQFTTLDSRAPEPHRVPGLLGLASVAVLAGEGSGQWAGDSAPLWLIEASPPQAPPPSFVLPLRV